MNFTEFNDNVEQLQRRIDGLLTRIGQTPAHDEAASDVLREIGSAVRELRVVIEKLRKRNDESTLEKFLATEHVLIAYMDKDFTFIRVNQAYAAADERPPEFYEGKGHFELFPNKGNEAIFRRVVETGEPYSAYAKPFEYTAHPERGITYWDWILLPINSADGEVEGLLLCLVDVTDRVRAEEKLKEYSDHLEELVEARTAELTAANQQLRAQVAERTQAEEALQDALAEARRNAAETSALLESSRYVLAHHDFEDAARAIFHSCKSLIGAAAGYVALLSKDERQNEVVYLDTGGFPCSVDPSIPMPIRGLRAAAYRSGKVVYDNKFSESKWAGFLPGGHTQLDNVLFAPLIIAGSPVGLIGLGNKPGGFTDRDAHLMAAFADHASIAFRNSRYLDAIKKSEDRYRHLSERLEETVRKKVAELKQAETLASIGRMVSTVAHEVRNPLQNIQMGMDAIREEIGEDKGVLEILDEIGHGVNSLNRIVKELLDYSKPLTLEHSPCSVREIVSHALSSLTNRLDNISTHVDLQDERREITVDPEKTCRVLLNLMSNAVEAMPGGGELEIRSRFRDDGGTASLTLTISDNGCGIVEEHMPHVFEPFFTTKASGTGLGIPICKKIVEAHGGNLRIESRPSKGTTVEITLPLSGSK